MKMLGKRLFVFFVVGWICVIASGCETFKGASRGFAEDWNKLKKWDKEFQETYW